MISLQYKMTEFLNKVTRTKNFLKQTKYDCKTGYAPHHHYKFSLLITKYLMQYLFYTG